MSDDRGSRAQNGAHLTVIPGEKTDQEDPLIGMTLKGVYDVQELLGSGGMGKVYLASDRETGRRVAIKVLDTTETDTKQLYLKRFQLEMQIGAKLESPHVVRVLGFGEVGGGGAPFIIMQYINGTNLDELVNDQGPLKLSSVISIIEQIAEGLLDAHYRGFVHRDIKPSNVMLQSTTTGRLHAMIADFGIAKALNAEAVENLGGPLTQTASAIGTPEFMAPEQLGNAEGVDVRADVYGLAGVTYFLLTGQSPGGPVDSLEATRRKFTGEFVPLTDYDEAILPVWEVVRKSLALDRDDRHESVVEFAQALAEAAEEMPRESLTSVLAVHRKADPEAPTIGVEALSGTRARQVSQAETVPRGEVQKARNTKLAVIGGAAVLSMAGLLVLAIVVLGGVSIETTSEPEPASANVVETTPQEPTVSPEPTTRTEAQTEPPPTKRVVRTRHPRPPTPSVERPRTSQPRPRVTPAPRQPVQQPPRVQAPSTTGQDQNYLTCVNRQLPNQRRLQACTSYVQNAPRGTVYWSTARFWQRQLQRRSR